MKLESVRDAAVLLLLLLLLLSVRITLNAPPADGSPNSGPGPVLAPHAVAAPAALRPLSPQPRLDLELPEFRFERTADGTRRLLVVEVEVGGGADEPLRQGGSPSSRDDLSS